MPNPEEHVNVRERERRTIFRACLAMRQLSLAADTRTRTACKTLGAQRRARAAADSKLLISAFILIEWPP
jgi:hypothetical protein